MTVENALQKLVSVARNQPRRSASVGSFRVPSELRDVLSVSHISIALPVQQHMDLAVGEVSKDLRFEWLSKVRVIEAVRRLVATSLADRSSRPAEEFIRDLGREVITQDAWYSVIYLTVDSPIVIDDVTIKPISDEFRRVVPDDEWDQRARSIALVSVSGTDEMKMIRRARDRARFALSVLRGELPNVMLMWSDEQLRFDVGDSCGFVGDDRPFRWIKGPLHDELTITSDLTGKIDSNSLSLVEIGASMRRQLKIALGWLDRARGTDDLLVRALYLFFAMEAILGDLSEGLKAHRLAFVEALLSHVEEGSFREPERLYYLYDELRSSAVHGSRDFDVDLSDVKVLDRRVHVAVRNFRTIVAREGIKNMKAFQCWLLEHPQASELLEWLRARNPDMWNKFNWPPQKKDHAAKQVP